MSVPRVQVLRDSFQVPGSDLVLPAGTVIFFRPSYADPERRLLAELSLPLNCIDALRGHLMPVDGDAGGRGLPLDQPQPGDRVLRLRRHVGSTAR